MKGKIFMYLFIFSLLLVLFQYMNSKQIFESYEKIIDRYESRQKVYEDSITSLKDRNFDLELFNLENNDDALSFFDDQGYNSLELIPFIKDELYKLNSYKEGDHPIVPYPSMSGNKMLINSVRLLNHKWLIANFTDGKNWGEMILSYEFLDGKELRFKVENSFMYPNN